LHDCNKLQLCRYGVERRWRMNPQSSLCPNGQWVHPLGYYLMGRTQYILLHGKACKCSLSDSFKQCIHSSHRWSLVDAIPTISHLWVGGTHGQETGDCRSRSITSLRNTYPGAPPDGHTNVQRIKAPPVIKLLIQKILNMGNRSPLSKSRERSVRQGGRTGDNNIRR